MDQKYKVWLFLSSYFVLAACHMIRFFWGKQVYAAFYGEVESGRIIGRITTYSALAFCGVCMLITLTTRARKVFRSRAIFVLMSGISLWLAWGVFSTVTGISLFATYYAYKELFMLAVFSSTVFMAARIIYIYDLKREFIGITAIAIALRLLVAFVFYSEGFAGFDVLINVFSVSERLRFAYGIGHYNQAGRLCQYFFIVMAMYRTQIRTSRDPLYIFLFAMSPIVMIMLLSTASRASILCLAVFWAVYYFLDSYHKTQAYTKAMFVILVLAAGMIIAASVNWAALWEYFLQSRGGNIMAAVPLLTRKGAWLTGFGFVKGDTLFDFINYGFMDNFYLLMTIQSGLIGSVVLIGGMYWAMFLYLQDIHTMNKIQRMAGALFVMLMFYGFLENLVYGESIYDVFDWTIFILHMAERGTLRADESYSSLRTSKLRLNLKGAVTL